MSQDINQTIHEALGHKWDESKCRVCGWPLVADEEAGCWASNCSMRPMPTDRADRIPDYWNSLEAAFRLAEKLIADDFIFTLTSIGKDQMLAMFNGGGLTGKAKSESAATAICLAGLFALGLDREPK